MDWFAPIANVLLAGALTVHYYRKRRVILVFWLIATYFGLLMIRDMLGPTLVYEKGLMPAIVDGNRIAGRAQFILCCNLCFLLGGAIGFRFTAKPGPALPRMDRDSWATKHLIWFYGILFAAACVWYLPSAYTTNYYDYVNNLLPSSPAKLAFGLGVPFATIAALQKRYVIAATVGVIGISVVFATTVREPVLIAVVPTLLILLLGEGHKDVMSKKIRGRVAVAVAVAGLCLAGMGTYINYVRTQSVELPEEGLLRGMYLVTELVDGGIKGTGDNSLETAAKALAFPFYNRYLLPDYNFPLDPAEYTAAIMVKTPVIGVGFQHYPFLWYTDVYLAGGKSGFWRGIVWGLLFGIWEGAMAGRAVIAAVLLPLFIWTMYQFERGSGALAMHFISRQLYFHLSVLVIGGLYLHLTRMRNARSASMSPAISP